MNASRTKPVTQNNSTDGKAEPVTNFSTFSTAYDHRLPEIEAVSDAELVALNLDVHSAVATVLGALPALEPLRNDIVALAHVDQDAISGSSQAETF